MGSGTTGGLSPRGRGKRPPIPPWPRGARSIPAWAGETPPNRWPSGARKVYPRVGGGNSAANIQVTYLDGLSPRGRGKHGHPPHVVDSVRVYPRVGGGNHKSLFTRRLSRGLSPRGRGKRPAAGAYLAVRGLSPRGRGKPPPAVSAHPELGSIPAWAGETRPRLDRPNRRRVYPRVGGGNRRRPSCLRASWGLSPAWAGETWSSRWVAPLDMVYPRVGGGNAAATAVAPSLSGLSPRGRGKPHYKVAPIRQWGSIPAWAGETIGCRALIAWLRVYPRVGGGNLLHEPPLQPLQGLSPRGRGKHQLRAVSGGKGGSIPAWAGETVAGKQPSPAGEVYPRVGGGNMDALPETHAVIGLSPRGRGKLRRSRGYGK